MEGVRDGEGVWEGVAKALRDSIAVAEEDAVGGRTV